MIPPMGGSGGLPVGGERSPDGNGFGGFMQAVEAARAASRGRPLEQVKARLVAELHKRDAFLPANMVEWHARTLATPGWAFRHPLRARRLLRDRDADSETAEAEIDSVQARLEKVIDHEVELDVRISSTRTMDGVRHEVWLDPWSDELAVHLRESVAPIEVEVKPRRRS
jgi:hypothetical protein